MPAIKLKWSELLHITELDFEPEPPKVLMISDELVQALSWLTGATGHDRRLLRCTEHGALLVGDAWALLSVVETAELESDPDNSFEFIASVPNKGVLLATSSQIIKAAFKKVAGGDTEVIYIPPGWLYWYPHSVYRVTVTCVPYPGGTISYVGLATFN